VHKIFFQRRLYLRDRQNLRSRHAQLFDSRVHPALIHLHPVPIARACCFRQQRVAAVHFSGQLKQNLHAVGFHSHNFTWRANAL